MMKFFRKHNKKLLGIFMSLLLIVWLGGTALESFFQLDIGRATLASTRIGEVKQGEFASAQAATDLLGRLGISWNYPVEWFPEPLEVMDWLLLEKEAAHLGIHVAPVIARQRLVNGGYSLDLLNRAAATLNIKIESIFDAAARNFTVTDAFSSMLAAARPSEAEIRTMARDQLERMAVKLVVLKSSALKDETGEFSESEIQAQFEKYRDVPGGAGMDFGYQIPPRITAEYFKIDVGKIAQEVVIPESTLKRKAEEFWEANKTKPMFRRPPEEMNAAEEAPIAEPTDDAAEDEEALDEEIEENEEPAADGDVEADQEESDRANGDAMTDEVDEADAEEAPANTDDGDQAPDGEEDGGAESKEPAEEKPKPSPYYETFEEARSIAEDEVKKQLAVDRAKELANALLISMREPWISSELQVDGFRKPPPGIGSENYFQSILERLPSTLRHRDAISITVTDPVTQAKARSLPDIGSATILGAPTSRTGFTDIAFNVQGIREMPEDPRADRSQYLALMEPYAGPLQDAEQNVYVFRVRKVIPAMAPESVDEVRDDVVADLRTLRAYEEAEKLGQGLSARAKEEGLDAALAADEVIPQRLPDAKVLEPTPFPRENETISGFGAGFSNFKGYVQDVGLVDDSFIDQIFSLVEGDGELRVTTVELPEVADPTVVVAEWIRTEPVTESQYLAKRGDIVNRIFQGRATEIAQNWLTSHRIRERLAFEPK